MAKKLKLSNERPGLIDFFFPARCIICREVQNPGVFICPQCARELSVTGSQVSQHGDFFDICYSPFFYEEPLRESFLRFKFSNRPQFSRQFGKWMADCLMAQDKTDFDLITWCPLHWLRKLDRGYDQSYLLAREIGQYITAPVVPTLKKAHRSPLSAMESTKAIRSAHLLGAYSVTGDVAGKRILLVDDVITSGSTMSECARMLKTAGAKEVIGLTLMRKR